MFCVRRFVTDRSKAEAEADRHSGRRKVGFRVEASSRLGRGHSDHPVGTRSGREHGGSSA